MKLDNLFDLEFKKLNLKKVRLKCDPAKPILPYEGYIIGEAPATGALPAPGSSSYPKPNPAATKTTLRQKTGGFLSKVGQTYQNLQKGAAAFKEFGQGNLGILKDVGVSMLEKQLDLDTNKVSVFGKKGYDIVEYIIEFDQPSESLDSSLSNLIKVYEAGPTGNRQTYKGLKPGQEVKRKKTPRTPKYGKIQDVPDYGPYSRIYWLVRDKKTGRFRKVDPSQVPPQFFPNPQPGPTPNPAPTPAPSPGPGSAPSPAPAPAPAPSPAPAPQSRNAQKLLLKIIKKDNAMRAGIPYVLVPADDATKTIMEKRNLSYVKFVKHVSTANQVEDAQVLDNSGKIYFYDLNNSYVPEYTETVNFVYKEPYYRMGSRTPRELLIMFDPITGAPVTTNSTQPSSTP